MVDIVSRRRPALDVEAGNQAALDTITPDWLSTAYDDAGHGLWDTGSFIGSNLGGGFNTVSQGPQYLVDYIRENRLSTEDIYAKERAQSQAQNAAIQAHMQNERDAQDRIKAEDARLLQTLTKKPTLRSPSTVMKGAAEYGSAPQRVYSPAAQQVPQQATQATPQRTTQATPQRTTQATPQRTAQVVSQEPIQINKGLGSQYQMLLGKDQAFQGPLEVETMLTGAPAQGLRTKQTEEQIAINKAKFAEAYPDYKYDATQETAIPSNRTRGYNISGRADPISIQAMNMRRASEGKINIDKSNQELQRLGLAGLVKRDATNYDSPFGTFSEPVRGRTDWKEAYLKPTDQQMLEGSLEPTPKREMRPTWDQSQISAGPGSKVQYHNPRPINQTAALDTNVGDPLGRATSLGTNQTSDSQINNNGNINNAANNYRTNVPPKKLNGFF